MEILPGTKIIDLTLYFDSTLVFSDIHIGYEEVLNKQGVLVPRMQFEEMVARVENVFKHLKDKKVDKIIVNGDLKHEFGIISEQEWRNTLKFLDILARHCNEIVLVKGNHDTVLGPIAKKRSVKVVESTVIGSILITHGNKVPEKSQLKEISTIIIGHEHPAISLKDGPRVETYKCFLKGKYKGKDLIVQPSFNTLIEGTDVLRDKILSPFLHQSIDNFEIFVVEDKVYEFGKLKKLRRS